MRIFLFLAFLSLASGFSMNTCPPAEDVYPCECQHVYQDNMQITCHDKSLSEKSILKRVLSSLLGKKILLFGLDSFKLGRVPSNFFSGIGINTLMITSCELDTLSEGGPALRGLENTLEELIISKSFKEDNIPAKLQIQHLKRLGSLTLSSNTIRELGDDWFKRGPTSLHWLFVSNNHIERLGSNAFADLINLRVLHLDGNRFGPIQRSMFPSPAYHLEHIYLESNGLTVLPEDLFTEMPALNNVQLDNNEIKTLDKRIWSPVWQQLSYLNLNGNPIRCDDHMLWLFKLKGPEVYGECDSPKELEYESIMDFIDSRRQQNTFKAITRPPSPKSINIIF